MLVKLVTVYIYIYHLGSRYYWLPIVIHGYIYIYMGIDKGIPMKTTLYYGAQLGV